MRRLTALLGLGSAIALAVPASVLATGSLDQSNTTLTANARAQFSDTGGYKQGQTFTAGLAGLLDQVDVYLDSESNGTGGSATLGIYATAAGLPTGAPLASESITGVSSGGTWVQVPLTTPIASSIGTQYAILLTSPDTTEWGWGLTSSDAYAGGSSLYYDPFCGCGWQADSGRDKGFKTYVSPATVAPDPQGIGYWRSNPTLTSSLLTQTLGSYDVVTYAMAKSIFDASNCGKPKGDAVSCLAGQLLATKLSIENGSDHGCIDANVAAADTFLSSTVGYHGVAAYALSKANRNTAMALQKTLATYNMSGCTG